MGFREAARLAGGWSRNTLYLWIKAGDFPRPIVIGRRRYWSERELQTWVAERLAKRDADPISA